MNTDGTLRAGTAQVAITPAGVVDLSGYGAREQPSLGVHDDIFARCLVLEQGGRRAAICSIEILGLDFKQVGRLHADLAADGYRPDDLLFCCTHTHGGPAVQSLRLCGTASEEYVEFLLGRIAAAVREAGRDTRECRVSAGSARCDLGINRRKPGVTGIELELNPQGETDPELVAARFSDLSGQTIAILFNYACHAVVLGGDNRLVSGDWPGAAMARMEAEGGGLALFLQGCCGDINPTIRGTYEDCGKAASIALDAVHEALVHATDADGGIVASSRRFALPLLPNPGDEELRKRLDEIEALPRDQWGWAEHRDAMWCPDVLNNPNESRREELDIRTGELSIGDLVIAWLPAEAFSAYSRNIKAARNPGRTMVAAYTNGNIGYLPTRTAYGDGGYEVDEAYRYYTYQMIGPESEALVLGSFQAG